MHEMMVPLGFAVPQLIPRFFVIIHKVIVIYELLRHTWNHPDRQTQKALPGERWPLCFFKACPRHRKVGLVAQYFTGIFLSLFS
jgi:hypothetical protein